MLSEPTDQATDQTPAPGPATVDRVTVTLDLTPLGPVHATPDSIAAAIQRRIKGAGIVWVESGRGRGQTAYRIIGTAADHKARRTVSRPAP